MKRSASIFAFSPEPRKKRRRRKPAGFLPSVRCKFELLIQWLQAQRSKRPPKMLRLGESVSLGDRRFAAVLEYGTQRFLVAGTQQSVSLLAELRGETFSHALVTQQSIGEEAE